ncbi:Acyl-CoA dehydrogenase [Pelotomaculum sp. FP]|uniref:acyl-CoA dehydrogenase family protein n=1 Tax=Pelotomaculum sp. FP TaxID=261474 RepID=UPI0010646BB1|nr:acyl-CoA dehydrogenase family protein [Pelotomaculum sp. FP]TEB14716.1 Acyl-CoA dehydrogenase [Pelotomaculum sp. FP]
MCNFTPEQLKLQKKVRAFIKAYIDPISKECDVTGVLPSSVFKAWADAGLACLVAPKETGGPELDTVTCTIVMEELGYAELGVATAFGANNLCSYPVLLAGTPEQQKKHFAPLLAGNYGAFALTEPKAGSDVGAISTTAKRDGDEYILNGTKCFITQGGVAATYVLFASTDKSKGSKGMSAFIVERDRPGLSIGKVEDKMGIHASNTVELILENVRIPAWHLLGNEGDGMKLAMMSLDAGRLMVAAQAVGVAQRALDECVDYIKKRVDSGKLLSAHQSVDFKIAEMATAIEAGRQLVYRGAELKDSQQPYSKYSAMAKLFCTDVAVQAATDAMEIMGAYGYTKDAYIEKVWRDVRILPIYEGTNQIQRIVISKAVLDKR